MSGISDEFEKSVSNPHDAAFKSAFRNRELAQAFFEAYLPAKIVRHIDFSVLETDNKSYVDEFFRDSHSDIVYRTRLRDRAAFLYLLFEHQSTPDHRMPFRLLCYMVNLWKDYEAQHPGTKHLPVIFPAVLYHGRRKWNAPLSFGDMIKGNNRDFRKFIPNFTYQLYDLSEYGDELLMPGNHMALAVVLYLFKHIFDKNSENVLRQATDLFVRIEDRTIFSEFIEWALTYFLHARNEDPEDIITLISRESERVGDERIRRAAMTAAEKLRQKGMEQGKLLGIEQGKLIGAEEGEKKALLKMLRRRFGSVPPVLEQKLRKSGTDVLDRFGEAIFDFKDLKDAEKWWESQ